MKENDNGREIFVEATISDEGKLALRFLAEPWGKEVLDNVADGLKERARKRAVALFQEYMQYVILLDEEERGVGH